MPKETTNDDWVEDLKKACLKVPIDKLQTDILALVRSFLSLRKYEIKCKNCGKAFMVSSMKEFKHKICPNCAKIRKEQRIAEEKKREEERRKYRKNKEDFKKQLVGTGQNTPAYDFYYMIDMIDEQTSKELADMKYKDFLRTLYWRIVSRYIKWKHPYCDLCKSKENLNVHHKTYENRGYEHLCWKEDLIVLCSECHQKFHEIN